MMIIFIIFYDEDLPRIRKRDPEVFEQIYREYSQKVYNFLIVKTNGNTHLAEEIFSDTFHSALKSAPGLKSVKALQSWLIQIANRRFIDYLRKKYRDKPRSEVPQDLADCRVDLTESIIAKDKVILLNTALNNINEDYRAILELKYIKHKTQKEIAQITGRSIPAVDSKIGRAKKALKAELKKIIKDM